MIPKKYQRINNHLNLFSLHGRISCINSIIHYNFEIPNHIMAYIHDAIFRKMTFVRIVKSEIQDAGWIKVYDK